MKKYTKKHTVPDVLPLVNAYYAIPGNEMGGNLHIVLEDGNVYDNHILFCLNRCIEKDNEAATSVRAPPPGRSTGGWCGWVFLWLFSFLRGW